MASWLRKLRRKQDDDLLAENRALFVRLHDAEDLAKRMEQEARLQRRRADDSTAVVTSLTARTVSACCACTKRVVVQKLLLLLQLAVLTSFQLAVLTSFLSLQLVVQTLFLLLGTKRAVVTTAICTDAVSVVTASLCCSGSARERNGFLPVVGAPTVGGSCGAGCEIPGYHGELTPAFTHVLHMCHEQGSACQQAQEVQVL